MNINRGLRWPMSHMTRYLIYNLRERSHNRSLITKTSYLKEHDFFIRILYKKWLLIDRLMCVAVVALSLAILLLYFITFIAFYCPVAFVNSWWWWWPVLKHDGPIRPNDPWPINLLPALVHCTASPWFRLQTLQHAVWSMDRFGACARGRRTGIIFNNNMDDTSTPGSVNGYGVVSSPSNYIEPGKRPMSSMSPSLVFDSSQRVVHVSGAAGGPRITTETAFVSLSMKCIFFVILFQFLY